MESAFAWVGALVEWFGQFVPRFNVIAPNDKALKFAPRWRRDPTARFGWRRTYQLIVCPPGFAWYWPAVTMFTVYPVAYQTTGLRAQTLSTIDGKTFVCTGLISFEVDDLEALLAHSFEPDQMIADRTMAAIQDCLQGKTWEELSALMKGVRGTSLVRQLTSSAQSLLKSHGVRVLEVRLIEFAQCRVYRLIGEK